MIIIISGLPLRQWLAILHRVQPNIGHVLYRGGPGPKTRPGRLSFHCREPIYGSWAGQRPATGPMLQLQSPKKGA